MKGLADIVVIVEKKLFLILPLVFVFFFSLETVYSKNLCDTEKKGG